MSLHIVMAGYDHTVFDPTAASDTHQRLQGYADELQRQSPGARLSYIVLRCPSQYRSRQLGRLHVHAVPGRSLVALAGFYRQLVQLHLQQPISLIAPQTPYEDGLIAWLFARRHHCRLLLQVHHDPAFVPGRLTRPLRRLLAGFLLPRATALRAVSSTTAGVLQQRYPHQTVHNLPVPTDLSGRVRPTPPASPAVLVVSRLSPEKNVAAAIEAMALLRQRLPACAFVIAGDGEQRQQLEAQASRLGINASFMGNVPHQQLSGLYEQASALLLTSREESYGRVIVEAMQHGVPVVATRTAGATALLEGTQAGLIVPQGDTPALADALQRLLSDNELNRQTGAAALAASAAYTAGRLRENLVSALIATAERSAT